MRDETTPLCACGCGQPAPVIRKNNVGRGYVIGQHHRYVFGHHQALVNVRDPVERFWEKVEKTDSCWLWTGARVGSGYGNFSLDGRRDSAKVVPAHRYAYELLVGPIPDGLELDHLCRVRACVNPAHLEPVTHQVNVERGARFGYRATHCVNGHPYDEANTYVSNDGRRRACKRCTADAQRRYQARKRASS